MIEHILFISKLGKCSLHKEYSNIELLSYTETLSYNIYKLILSNIDTNIIYDVDLNVLCNIKSKINNTRNVFYRYFNGIFVVFVCDLLENELAIIDFINLVISIINEGLSNFDEQTIILNLEKVHFILDEIIIGGTVVELDSKEVLKSYKEIIDLK